MNIPISMRMLTANYFMLFCDSYSDAVKINKRWFGSIEQFRAVSQVDFPLGYAATGIGLGVVRYA